MVPLTSILIFLEISYCDCLKEKDENSKMFHS